MIALGPIVIPQGLLVIAPISIEIGLGPDEIVSGLTDGAVIQSSTRSGGMSLAQSFKAGIRHQPITPLVALATAEVFNRR